MLKRVLLAKTRFCVGFVIQRDNDLTHITLPGRISRLKTRSTQPRRKQMLLLFIHNYTQVEAEVVSVIDLEMCCQWAQWDLDQHDYPEAFDVMGFMGENNQEVAQ